MIFLPIFILVTTLMLMVRNNQVHRARMEILREISILAHKDIDQGKDWIWRYDEFDKVSYNKQVLMFWLDIRSSFNPEIFKEKGKKK